MSDENILIELKNLRADMKLLKRQCRKIHEFQTDPDGEKAKARSLNNGFNKPQDVTPELASFLGLKEGEQISRANVTKQVSNYIKEKDLMNPKEKRQILLDDALKTLLNPPEGLPISHTSMQTYLAPHYIKTKKEEVKVVVEEAPKKVVEEVPKKKKKVIKKKTTN